MRRSLAVVALSAALLLPSIAAAGWDEGVAAFTAKNYKAAAAEFQKLVEQSPEGYQGYYMLGLTLEQLNRKSEALQHLSKAYDLNPNDLSVKMSLGKAYSSNRRYGDAAKLLGTVDPSSLPGKHKSAIYQIRGQSRLKSGDSNGALSDFRELAKLNPKSADFQFVHGSTALSVDRLDEAIAAFGKAHVLKPADHDMTRAYANALIKKGRTSRDKAAKKSSYTKATTVARKLSGTSPTFENYMLLISAELGAGLYQQAIDTGKRAVAKNDNDWLAQFYLGQAYSSSGRFSEAEAPLNAAKTKTTNPDDLRMIWRQLGFVFEKQQKYSASIAAYGQAGDQGAMSRVKENQETAEYNQTVERKNREIEAMEEEAKELEEELKKLQGGGRR